VDLGLEGVVERGLDPLRHLGGVAVRQERVGFEEIKVLLGLGVARCLQRCVSRSLGWFLAPS
jgi:hypothetical protein